MRYRLPLELELTILEFAAPPLAIDSLHDRVAFLINVSLAHRFFTAWAQERLHDQFLYTYRPHSNEHERLKMRLEAGFGRDRPLRRLYLDLTRLPANIRERIKPGADSVSATINGRTYGAVSEPSGACHGGEGGTSVREQACDAVVHFEHPEDAPPPAGYWRLCAMISSYSQTLDTLWLRPSYLDVNINDLSPPRVLYIDDKIDSTWGFFRSLPSSSKTTLFLRNTGFGIEWNDSDLDMCHLILANCRTLSASLGELLDRFGRLETLVLVETENDNDDLVSTLVSLPTTVRCVHVLDVYINIDNDLSDAPVVLPHLESFTFTLLLSEDTPADDGLDALAGLQHAVELSVVAPRCTFKYLRSTKAPEDALADAMADLGLDL